MHNSAWQKNVMSAPTLNISPAVQDAYSSYHNTSCTPLTCKAKKKDGVVNHKPHLRDEQNDFPIKDNQAVVVDTMVCSENKLVVSNVSVLNAQEYKDLTEQTKNLTEATKEKND